MFGSSGFQQPQQQTAFSTAPQFGASSQTTTFGTKPASTMFGSTATTGGFGTTGAVGSSTPFAGSGTSTRFGTPTTSTGGFGAQTTSSGVFGTPSNQGVGVGGFGTTQTAGSGGFGAQTSGTTFAQKPSTSPFASSTGGLTGSSPFSTGGGIGGTTSGPFGAQQTSTGFGMSTSNPQAQGLAFGSSLSQTQNIPLPFSGAGTTGVVFGGSAFGATGAATPSIGGATSLGGIGMSGLQQQPGTGHVPFQPTIHDEKSTTGVPSNLMSITAMKEYEGKSFEELRMEDYAKGNKGGSAAGGFAMTSFMQQPQATTGGQSGFGAANPAAMGTFGGTSSLVSGWGSTPAPTFGAPSTFGTQTGPTTGTGLFGQQTGSTTTANIFSKPSTTTTTPFNISAPATTGGFSFGSAAPATAPQAFGAPATTSSSLFGAPAPTATTSTPFSGTFAAPAPATGTVGFGAAATPAPATGAFSLGGSTPAPASGGGLFGGASTLTTALSTGGGLFGKTPAAAPALTAPTGGYSFGSTAPVPATGGFGLSSAAPAAKTQTPSFSFSTAPAAGGGLFGATAAAPAAGKGLWGGGTTSGLFSSARAPSMASSSLTGTAPATFGGTPLFATQPDQQQQPLQALLADHSQSVYGKTEPGSHGAGELLQKVEAVTRTSSALELGLGPSGGGEIPPTTEGSHEFYQMNGIGGSGRLASSMGRVRGAMRIAPRGLGGDHDSTSPSSLPTGQMNGEGGRGNLPPSARELVESNRLLSLSNSETTFSGVIDPRAFAGRSTKRLIINTPAPKASDALPGLLDAPPLIANGITSNPDLPTLPAVEPAPIAPTNSSSTTSFETPSKKKEPKELDFQSHGVRLPVHESEDQDATAPSPPHRLSTEVQQRSSGYNVPLLRRPGYGCKPSLKDMSSMSDSELSSVTNFSIWHTSFGSITFLKPVDLKGVDLDAVISIDRRDVAVYDMMEEKDKVPVGHGLNQPAMITMHGVFPGSKWKKGAKTYEDGLKKKAEAMGAVHEKYDELGGVWTFKVPHFSRYSLAIDDENCDNANEEIAMQQRLQRKNKDGESKGTEEMRESGMAASHHPPAALGLSIKWLGDVYPSGGSSSLAAAPVGVEFSDSLPIPSSLPHSIATAIASIVDDVEMDTSTSPLEDSSPPIGKHHRKPFLKTSVLQNTRWCRGMTIGGGGQSRVRLIHASPSAPDAHLLDNSPCLKIFNKVVAKNFERNRGEKQFGVKSSRVVASDFGLRMGWSFPVSWGPNGEIVWCGTSNSVTRNDKMNDEDGGGLHFSVYVDRLALGQIRGEGVEKSLMVNKRYAIASSTAAPRPEDAAVMKWSMNDSYTAMVNCVHDYIECSSTLEVDDSSSSSSSSSSSLEMRECWNLVSALWGQEKRRDEMEKQKQQLDLLPIPPYPHPPAYDTDGCSPLDRRWLAIRKWLAGVVERKGQRKRGGTSRRPSASAETKFLERLLSMRVDESAHLAAASTFSSSTPSPRLATLIALAMGGDPFVREQLRMQLCQWNEAGASDLIPHAVRQTLELLSGGGASSACGHGGALLGTEWLEQLAECLFYNAPEGEAMTLAQVLAVFDDVISFPPLAEYALAEEVKSYADSTSSTTSTSSRQEKSRKFSLIYHLLHLYATEGSAGLTRCLDPASLTHDLLDYSISWHLMLVLDGLKLPYPNPPVSVKSTITASIVSQLCLGSSKNIHHDGGRGGALWPWAAFVLLYENNGWEYAASIDTAREIIMRFGYSTTQEEWTLAVDYLGLPEVWLQESAELFLQYQNDASGNRSTNFSGSDMPCKSVMMG